MVEPDAWSMLVAAIVGAAIAAILLWHKIHARPKIARSTCQRWASMPSDTAQLLLNTAGLRTSTQLACASRHWRGEVRNWRPCGAKDLVFSRAERERVTEASIHALVMDCTGLLLVDVTGCTHVGGDGVRCFTACPRLEVLRLPSTAAPLLPWAKRLRFVEDADLVCLAKGCPRLSTLTGPCGSFGDDALRAFGAMCSQLRVLSLAPCPSVSATDQGLVALAAGCPRLEELDVTGGRARGSCGSTVTDEGLQALARGCRSLEHLNAWCYALVTDRSVDALVSCCPDLEDLNLSECRLTDAALATLARRASPKLHSLNVSGCTQLSQGAIDALVVSCPQLVDLGDGLLVYNDPNHSHSH